jgi:ribosomal protein S12 methylthiotransferase accessory factor
VNSVEEVTHTGRLLELVSPEVGLIRSLSPVVRGADEPNPPVIYQAMLSHFDYRLAKDWERVAVGKGFTRTEAMLGAIGEAVEHYCASHFDQRTTFPARWASVEANAIAPSAFVLYSPKQYANPDFAYRPWDPDLEVRWFLATELPTKHQVYVPATLVYLSLGDAPAPDFFCPPTSNGLAAGPNLQTATFHGLLELIERDAFLITWMNRLSVASIEISARTQAVFSICEHYAKFGVSVRLYNISTDLLPYVVMALAVDKSGDGPAAVIGLGCHPNPVIAATKALFEVCQARPGEIKRFRREQPSKKLQSYRDVRGMEDHSAFFHPVERLEEFSFLLDSSRSEQLEELRNRSCNDVTLDLDNCVKSLTQSGARVFYADLTTSDVAPYGLRVVRTLVTGLQPMHFGFGEERLGGSRLFALPRKLGHGSQIRTEEDLNPSPHPLA